MRVLVCGSRHLRKWSTLFKTLDGLKPVPTVIIHGDARGADTGADVWAETFEYRSWDYGPKIERYPADWEKYGKAAGPIRNQQMLDEGKPDLVVAFLAPNSRGTKDMIDRATKAGVECRIINIKD